MDDAISTRLLSLESGRYRRQTDEVLSAFAEWATREHDVDELTALDETLLRRYAQHLARRVDADEIAASTANTYFDIVRAWLSWCVRDGRIETNPADRHAALEPLPSDAQAADDQQFWTPGQRDTLLRHTDEAAADALEDGDEIERIRAMRDRGLAYLLAYSGARGAEIARQPDDDQREGLRWQDLNLDQGTVRVLGKSREVEYAQLLSPVVEKLQQYERVLQPPDQEWPVFPPTHHATLYDAVGYREVNEHPLVAAREDATSGGRLPNISTHSVRNTMQRLTEAAGVDVDDGYLQPHGARRGLGSQLYEQDAELAQETLRHRDISVTHDAYRDVQAAKRREDVEDVLFGGGSGSDQP